MQKPCETCSTPFEYGNNKARFCSDKCRKRAARRLAKVVEFPAQTPELTPQNDPNQAQSTPISSLLGKIRSTLAESGVLETPNGQLALKLAERLETQTNDSGSSVAALSKELRMVMAEALNRVVAADDPIDELQRRREARRRA